MRTDTWSAPFPLDSLEAAERTQQASAPLGPSHETPLTSHSRADDPC